MIRMNCYEFEAAVGELAGERLMDATQREKALAHAAICTGCAARFADERALTDGLRVVADTADEEAPARVGAALLAAFHGQIQDSRKAVRVSSRTRWVYAAASVAAITLMVVLISLMTSRSADSQQPGLEKAANPGAAVPLEPRPAAPQQQITPGSPVSVTAAQRRRPAGRVRNVSRSSRSMGSASVPANEVDIATDFIPLMNRELFAEMDGGQVMRVELPRSALMSFGLPMDVERANQRIKADVVVGNDGLARAIRFVR